MNTQASKTTTIVHYVMKRILPVIVPIMVCAFFITYLFTYKTIEDQQYKAIESELSFSKQTLDNRIQTTEKWLKNLAENGMIINSLVDPQGAGEYIPQLIKTLRTPGPLGAGHIELLDFQGKTLASNNVETSLEIRKDWLDGVLNGDNYESITYEGLIMAEPIIINGLPEGAIVLLLDKETLSGFLSISSANGFISVVDDENHIIYAPENQEYFLPGNKFEEDVLQGWVISKRPIYGSSNLFVIFKQKNVIAFKALQDVQYALIVFILISVSGILLSLSISGRIVKKVLDRVAGQIKTLRIGKSFPYMNDVSPIQEIANLENAYNNMAQDLKDTAVSRDYIDRLFEALPLPIFVLNKDGMITMINSNAMRVFSLSEAGPQIYFKDFIVDEKLDALNEQLNADFNYKPEGVLDGLFFAARKMNTYETDIKLQSKESTEKPYILSITPLWDKREGVSGYVITATDIQERMQREKEILELAEQNTLMARAIEEIDLGITISDGTQRHQPLIFCNQAFMNISGRNLEEILGFSCDFMQGPETDPETVKKLSDAIVEQNPVTVEILNYNKNGESFWNELSLNPIFSSEGTLKYYVGIQHDISERKRIESMKKEFVSTVSHELRTPLTSIHGSLGLINDLYLDDTEGEEKELLSVAYRNSERLKVLVDDILDTEKLESGEMRFRMETHDVQEMLQHSVDLNKPYGERYGVEFKIVDFVTDKLIYVDKGRMIQVFSNLLSNAAKFSNGSRHVDIKSELLDQENTIRFSITDYGDGISKEFQKDIFTKFAQQDSSDARKLPGTGLGLYITKQIIDAHDGRIDFTTEEGKGTTFFFDLPIQTTDLSGGKNVK